MFVARFPGARSGAGVRRARALCSQSLGDEDPVLSPYVPGGHLFGSGPGSMLERCEAVAFLGGLAGLLVLGDDLRRAVGAAPARGKAAQWAKDAARLPGHACKRSRLAKLARGFKVRLPRRHAPLAGQALALTQRESAPVCAVEGARGARRAVCGRALALEAVCAARRAKVRRRQRAVGPRRRRHHARARCAARRAEGARGAQPRGAHRHHTPTRVARQRGVVVTARAKKARRAVCRRHAVATTDETRWAGER